MYKKYYFRHNSNKQYFLYEGSAKCLRGNNILLRFLLL